MNVMNLKGDVTVTAEADGTFFVRIGGVPFTRWPTLEIAEKRSAAVRRYDAQVAAMNAQTTRVPDDES